MDIKLLYDSPGLHMDAKDESSEDEEVKSRLPFLWMTLFLSAYSFGAGPVSWSLISDSFPIELQIPTAVVTNFVGWFSSFVTSTCFSRSIRVLKNPWIMWIFSSSCFLCAVTALTNLKETKGKSLADIRDGFEPAEEEVAQRQ